MRVERAEIHVDARIATAAEAQGGVVSRRQLVDAGLSRQQISRRLADGRLRKVHQGIYALSRRRLHRAGLRHAALLAQCGLSALSHLEAGAFWGLRVRVAAAVHVTVASANGRHRREGVVLHRAPVPDEDWVVREGLRVTAPARTLIDLGSCLDARGLFRAADEAHLRGLVTRRGLAEALDRNAGRPGAAKLLAALWGHELGTTVTESELEERFVVAYQRWGRFTHRCQEPLPPYRADVFFPEQRVVVEVDGPAHLLRSRRRSDAIRDARLEARGFSTIRVTEAEMDADIRGSIARVDRALSAIRAPLTR